MKRVLLALSVSLIFLTSNQSMARDVSIELRLGQQKVKVGDEFSVKVNIDQVSDLKGINIIISFDDLRLKYKSIFKESLISNFTGTILTDPANTPGKIEYLALLETQGPGMELPGGSILTITFMVKSPGEAWIKLEPNDVPLSDSMANAIPATIAADRYEITIGEIYKMEIFNYPNPVSGADTTIRCEAKAFLDDLEVRIYDISGELVKIIDFKEFKQIEAPVAAIVYEYLWDCKNEARHDVANGTYILWAKASFKGSDDYDTWKLAVRH